MKILRHDDDRIGALAGETIVDIGDLIPHRVERGPQGAMEELIGNFAHYKPRIEDRLAKGTGRPLAEAKLLSPLARPGRVMAAFANYLDSPTRTKDSVTLEFFHKCPYLVGPSDMIELPDIPQVLVYQAEAELAFVIGKPARRVAEADAMAHVFGYIPFFDVSARGLTRRSQLLGKGQETFAACGPWITTADEIADPHDLTVQSWIAGVERQNYSTKHMAHGVAAQLAWLSRFVHLRPGDLLATGVYHVGLWPINVGDTIEIAISGLGKAAFRVGGDSPRKHVDFTPGGTGGTGGGAAAMTRV